MSKKERPARPAPSTFPSDPPTFGQRLGVARTCRQIDQQTMAELVSVALVVAGERAAELPPLSKHTISSWESGKHRPGHPELVAAARVLQVSVDVLLGVAPFEVPALRPGHPDLTAGG